MTRPHKLQPGHFYFRPIRAKKIPANRRASAGKSKHTMRKLVTKICALKLLETSFTERWKIRGKRYFLAGIRFDRRPWLENFSKKQVFCPTKPIKPTFNMFAKKKNRYFKRERSIGSTKQTYYEKLVQRRRPHPAAIWAFMKWQAAPSIWFEIIRKRRGKCCPHITGKLCGKKLPNLRRKLRNELIVLA